MTTDSQPALRAMRQQVTSLGLSPRNGWRGGQGIPWAAWKANLNASILGSVKKTPTEDKRGPTIVNAAYTGQIKVRFADTDANGHTYFGSYLVLADEVVSEYLAQVGWDGGTDGDFLTFTVNANIDFVGECMAWDILEVSCRFTKMGNSSCALEFEMLNTSTNEVATRGSFTYVFVDKATRKSRPIPQAIKTAIIAAQPELAD